MKNAIKIFIIVLILLSVVGVIIYFLLFSPKLANNLQIIPVRRAYVNTIDNVIKVDELKPPIVVLSREKTNPQTYWYQIKGKVEKVDKDSIYLRGSDNKIYRLLMDWRQNTEGYVQYIVLNNGQRELMSFDINNIERSINLDEGYDLNKTIEIHWGDLQNLDKMINTYKSNPDQTLNSTTDQIKFVFRYE